MKRVIIHLYSYRFNKICEDRDFAVKLTDAIPDNISVFNNGSYLEMNFVLYSGIHFII